MTPALVILSGARTSRREVLAESKDPYSLSLFHNHVLAFSPCTKAGCPILARPLRKDGIPRPHTSWWFDFAPNLRGRAI
jgi:hypothetical protein